MSLTVGFWHFQSGASLSLDLHPLTGGAAIHSGGSLLSETDSVAAPGFYSAFVTEPVAGDLIARVRTGGAVIYQGLVHAPAGGGTAIIDAGVDSAASSSAVTVSEFSAAALAQLAAGPGVEISFPMLHGQDLSCPLVRGDAYLASQGRSLRFSRSDFPDIPSGSEALLRANRTGKGVIASFQAIGQVVVAEGTKVIEVELTSSQTADLEPGRYEFDVEVTFPDGNRVMFAGPHVYLRVLADVQ